jgi:peptidyl-prolyl cis-trans isomerase D
MWRSTGKTLDGLDPQKIKKNAGIYSVLLVALGAMTFFGVCNPHTMQVSQIVSGNPAKVGREEISRNEFRRNYSRTLERYQRMYSEAFDPKVFQLSQMVINELVDGRILYQKSVALGFDASDDEVLDVLKKESVFNDEKGQFSDERYNQILRSQGYTEQSLMDEIRRQIASQRFRRAVADSLYTSSKEAELDFRLAETKVELSYLKIDPQVLDVAVAQADIDKFLGEEQYKKPEKVKARHILVGFTGSRNASPEAAKRSKADAQKRAEEILAKVKAPGADFSKLAKEWTDEPAGKTNGGDLGEVEKGRLDPVLTEALFALEAGSISSPVESPSGFHIILAETKIPAVDKKLEDVQVKIAEGLIAKEKKPALAKERAEKVVAEIKASRPLDTLMAEYKLSWADTGEFSQDAKFIPGIGNTSDVQEALSQLQKPLDIYPNFLDIRGNLYILRLKSRKEPDMSKFDQAKKRELRLMASYTDSTSLVQMYEAQSKAELEKKGKIWINPSYLALDQKQAEPGQDGG